ncbi:root hair defective 3 GTP-binding protein [Atractiella rhizophila]|nr:root hair defective 3 GTP-binding protein [Atractiella rhizophila]
MSTGSIVNGNGSYSSSNGEGTEHTLQIIDESQQFSTSVPDSIKRWGLYDAGFGYDVVAVFGSQSTGKSTLLNRLFGSKFAVMSETERRQTTKGIWMTRAKGMNVLVMDVEGTDGRERGEDQDFERKSALFSLATSEVLIVNLWEHQVGLYQGANMGLLKTVFEVNLGLFQASSKGSSQGRTLLLFVIRDHVGSTPLANLQNTLTSDMAKIWEGLSKPSGLESARLEDYFDLAFFPLPHKILQPEEFEKQVLVLRKRFEDSKDPDFVFKPVYHKRIPADGVGAYMNGIWDQVVSNKDLDLPTQQELLAQFRCDEIAAGVFEVFEGAVKSFRRPVEQGVVVPELGEGMGSARKTALDKFDTAASRYHQGVYHRKRADLLSKINASLSPLFLGQVKNSHKAIVLSFKTRILERLRGEGYDFGAVVREERERAESTFDEEGGKVLLTETEWSLEESKSQLLDELETIAAECRVEETKKMVALIDRNLKKDYGEKVELALNNPEKEMWDKVVGAFVGALEKAENTYLRKAKGFNSTDEENESALKNLRKKAWLSLTAKIDEQTADTVMLVKLKMAFEERFRYDDDGVPRIWRPEDDIDGLFRKAREATLSLIPLYSKISPTNPELSSFSLPSEASEETDLTEPEFDFPSTLIIFTESKQADLASRFRREADAYYVEAKRSMVSSISQIPYWMYGVVALLGWNEFIAVIRSPVYFTMLLVLGAAAYVTVALGMAGPVLALGRGISREVFRVGNEQLRNYYAGESAPSARVHPPSRRTEQEDIPMRDLKEKKDA